MFLPKSTFTGIIQNTPLISIDLIIKNAQGNVLLGLRNNRPALDYWFVPGGRIYKNESLAVAFDRLCMAEVGLAHSLGHASFHGVYEHFYPDSVFDEAVSTHYVVLAYCFYVDPDDLTLAADQHSTYRWVSVRDLLEDKRVHQHTQNYFIDGPGQSFLSFPRSSWERSL